MYSLRMPAGSKFSTRFSQCLLLCIRKIIFDVTARAETNERVFAPSPTLEPDFRECISSIPIYAYCISLRTLNTLHSMYTYDADAHATPDARRSKRIREMYAAVCARARARLHVAIPQIQFNSHQNIIISAEYRCRRRCRHVVRTESIKRAALLSQGPGPCASQLKGRHICVNL